jgi:predicted MPP superfamily phosphohydrolase
LNPVYYCASQLSFFSLTFAILLAIVTIAPLSSFLLPITFANNNKSLVDQDSLDFNFAAVGDFGCNTDAKETLRNIFNLRPEVLLALGDLSYEPGSNCWFDMIAPLEKYTIVKIAFGYHDIFDGGGDLLQSYLRHFNLAKQFYSFDYRNIHFLSMATELNYSAGSDQYQFVVNDLKKASNNSKITWIVVYSFRPFYSSPSTHPGPAELRDTYHPLFDKYGVDLVLQAHVHNYQRTFPIVFNSIHRSIPIIESDNTSNYTGVQKGPLFITIGTAGQEFHTLYAQVPFVVRQFERHGFVNIVVTENGRKLVGSFYDNNSHKLLDQFTIAK